MSNKKLIALGIIGALLVGLGDYLLGYVEPTVIENSSLLKIGYGADYNLYLPIVSMLVASVGMIFYVPMFLGISNTITSSKLKKAFLVTSACGFFGWLMIHYYVSSLVYQYAWGVQNGVNNAFEYTTAVLDAFSPIISSWYCIVIIPFILHFFATITGKTSLPKATTLANPLLCLLYIAIILSVLPESKFASALQMGIASEAILIWIITLLSSYHRKDVCTPLKGF